MTSKSNDNGRALEYSIVDYFKKNHPNVVMSKNTLDDQKRDSIKFQNLPQDIKVSFTTAAKKFFIWYKSINTNHKTIKIDRLSDSSGVVHDIVINSINFSVKHNHYALKHPRPYSLAIQCGFDKNDSENIIHRNDMKIVSDNYRKNLNGIKKYSENKQLLSQLYASVNQICKRSIDKWCKHNPLVIVNFFNFIVGTKFYKVIVSENNKTTNVEIQDFLNIPTPQSLVCVFDSKRSNYLNFTFNHGWIIDLRLHTASSMINTNPDSQLSLKFDAQKKSGNVKTFNI